MSNTTEIRRQLTDRIIAALENNVVPWRKCWTSDVNTGRAANAVSGKKYSGINPLLLELHALEHGFRSRWWATYAQWQQLGCQVQRRPEHVPQGHWGATICFFKPVTKTVVDPVSSEQEEERFCVLRNYSVFCADQIIGPNAAKFQVKEDFQVTEVHPNFQPADELIEATGAEIRHAGGDAFYRTPTPRDSWPNHTGGDFIQVPCDTHFDSKGAYYETLFHELAHWSEVRLQWKSTYALSELVAEMASCFVGAELGIPNGEGLDNHAAYLKNWLSAMRGDPTYIFRAATQASKVTDFLLEFSRKPQEVIQPEEELIPF